MQGRALGQSFLHCSASCPVRRLPASPSSRSLPLLQQQQQRRRLGSHVAQTSQAATSTELVEDHQAVESNGNGAAHAQPDPTLLNFKSDLEVDSVLAKELGENGTVLQYKLQHLLLQHNAAHLLSCCAHCDAGVMTAVNTPVID